MQLFVIRHAIAEDSGPGGDDAARALTAEGAKKMKQVVRGLRALELELPRVLTSPWTRALETAELLAPIARPSRSRPTSSASRRARSSSR